MTDTTGGISFTGAIFILFLGLKLAGLIDWKWIWIFSPIWISAAIALLAFTIWALFTIIQSRRENKRFKNKWGKK